jgi:hypothetical protein
MNECARACHILGSCDARKRETTVSLETLIVIYQTVWRYIPEARNLDMFVLSTATLKYKGRSDESKRGHTLHVLQACFIMAVKFSGIAAFISEKENYLTASYVIQLLLFATCPQRTESQLC